MFKSDEKVGAIATKFPGSMEIFQKNKIDFCCGGDKPLAEAIKENGLDQEKIMQEINTAFLEKEKEIDRVSEDWTAASPGQLIDYIVSKHHNYLQEKLPEISELVTTILRVHGGNHGDVLRKVHRLFHNLKLELEQHLIKEEEVLFPLIKEYENQSTEKKLAEIFKVIDEIEGEHEDAGDILKELRRVTEDYLVPDDGCRTYQLTYRLLEEVEEDLFRHIHLENNILFPGLKQKKAN